MKVELHLHTSRYSACSIATPFELMAKLIDAGYEAVYITEHDRTWQDWEIAHLQEDFPAIRIFPGVELCVGDEPMQHLLVLGTDDPEYLALGETGQVLAKARAEGHLTVLAHPFRWEATGGVLDQGLLPDALEYHTPNHSAKQAKVAKAAAEKYPLPLVNAGDVHALDFVNRYWIETDRRIERADEIRDIVLAGEYRNGTSDRK